MDNQEVKLILSDNVSVHEVTKILDRNGLKCKQVEQDKEGRILLQIEKYDKKVSYNGVF